jgi:hypothetical protein
MTQIAIRATPSLRLRIGSCRPPAGQESVRRLDLFRLFEVPFMMIAPSLHPAARRRPCSCLRRPLSSGLPTSFSLISNAGAGSTPIRAWRLKPRSAPQDAEAAGDWRPPTMPARLPGARPARVWSRNARRIISAPFGMLAKLPPCCLRDRLGPRRPAASFSRN